MCEVASFKNFETSLTTVKVMTKTKVVPFYLGHGLYTGWPNKNRTFLRKHIFAATTYIIMRFFAELFRNYSRKQQAI